MLNVLRANVLWQLNFSLKVILSNLSFRPVTFDRSDMRFLTSEANEVNFSALTISQAHFTHQVT